MQHQILVSLLDEDDLGPYEQFIEAVDALFYSQSSPMLDELSQIKDQFPRHRAFQAELKQALQRR